MFGTSSRVLVDIPSSGSIRLWRDLSDGLGITTLAADRFFSYRTYSDGSRMGLSTMFFTLPDAGRGTATMNNVWFYSDVPDTVNTYGCGPTISYDGSLVAWNLGLQCPDAECWPCRGGEGAGFPRTDHKGFVITEFMTTDSPSCGRVEYVEDHSISVTWCPPKYRFGEYNEVDFMFWSWTNLDDYIIGVLRGSKAPDPGVWLINWKTNEWTYLSDSMRVAYPAAHIAAVTTISHTEPSRSMQRDRTSIRRCHAYDIRGRLVTQYGGERLFAAEISAPGIYLIRSESSIRRRFAGK